MIGEGLNYINRKPNVKFVGNTKIFSYCFPNCFQVQPWPITVIKNIITRHMHTMVKFLRHIKSCDDAITDSSHPPDSLQVWACSATSFKQEKNEVEEDRQ